MIKRYAFFFCWFLTLAKLPCTLLVPFTDNATAVFSNTSLIITLLRPLHKSAPILNWIALIVIAVTWLLIFVLLILGIRRKGLRVFVLIPIIFLAVLDCIFPLLFSNLELKIYALLYSMTIIGLCIEACKGMKRISYNN